MLSQLMFMFCLCGHVSRFPTQSRNWLSMSTARWTIVMTYIVVPIICTPVYLSFTVVEEEDRDGVWYRVSLFFCSFVLFCYDEFVQQPPTSSLEECYVTCTIISKSRYM